MPDHAESAYVSSDHQHVCRPLMRHNPDSEHSGIGRTSIAGHGHLISVPPWTISRRRGVSVVSASMAGTAVHGLPRRLRLLKRPGCDSCPGRSLSHNLPKHLGCHTAGPNSAGFIIRLKERVFRNTGDLLPCVNPLLHPRGSGNGTNVSGLALEVGDYPVLLPELCEFGVQAEQLAAAKSASRSASRESRGFSCRASNHARLPPKVFCLARR